MRSVPTLAVALAFSLLAVPASAFDVQSGSNAPVGAANLAPDAGATQGISIDTDLRAQLGLPDDKAGLSSKSGLQFGGGVFTRDGRPVNTSTMGFDERPWVAPRTRPGH